MGFGDVVSKVVTPVAGAFGHPCVDPETGVVIPGTPCDKRIDSLNRFGDKMYDIFWPTKEDSDSGT
jgi:hypothetical protein